MNEEEEFKKFQCMDMEITYAQENGIDFNQENLHLENVFPSDWFSYENYDKKMEILKEAMDKKVLISKTEGFLDICEGVRSTSVKR